MAEPGVDQLAKVIGVLETAHRVQGKLNGRVAAVGALTLNQAVVLSEVGLSNGRATVSTLAATLGRAVHTLTSAINGLERKGLVARHTVAGEDRRIIRIEPTSAGDDALKAVRAASADIIGAVADDPFSAAPAAETKGAVDAALRLFGV